MFFITNTYIFDVPSGSFKDVYLSFSNNIPGNYTGKVIINSDDQKTPVFSFDINSALSPSIITINGVKEANWNMAKIFEDPNSDVKQSTVGYAYDISRVMITNDAGFLYVAIEMSDTGLSNFTLGMYCDRDGNTNGTPLTEDTQNIWARSIWINSLDNHAPDTGFFSWIDHDTSIKSKTIIGGIWEYTDRSESIAVSSDFSFIECRIPLVNWQLSPGQIFYFRVFSSEGYGSALDVVPVDDSAFNAEAENFDSLSFIFKTANDTGAKYQVK